MKEISIEDILERTWELKRKKIWFVSIIWRPNSWKSTFLNSLIWEKISIATNIPQTTRNKITAVYNDDDSQIIFFDTPWIHKSEKSFNEQINNQSISSLKDADVILYFIDSTRVWWEEETYIKSIISIVNKPVIKVYTKIDLQSSINLPENSIQISSINKVWFEDLVWKIKSYFKLWEMLFPEDIYTKQNIYFRISEIIREQVFLNTKEEIPHSVFIWVEEIVDEDDMLKIVSYIYTETDSQKYIIIWKKWSLIWKIWKESRELIEKIFNKKTFLSLRVKVKKWWKKDEEFVKRMLW
jgi:GTPase